MMLLRSACDDSEEGQMETAMAMQWLQALLQQLRPAGNQTRGTHKFSASALVAAHLCSAALGNKGMLSKHAFFLVHTLFPNVFAFDGLSALLSKLPSAAVLSRSNVIFDAAYVMLSRWQNTRMSDMGCARYIWIDSSPQHGYDWFLCKDEEQVISNSDLLPLAAAVDRLSLAHMEQELLHQNEMDSLEATIDSSMHVHLKVPVAKGSGHSNVEHLASCFLHTLLLESTGRQHVGRMRMEHVSVTSDLGTESHIRSFIMQTPECLLHSLCFPDLQNLSPFMTSTLRSAIKNVVPTFVFLVVIGYMKCTKTKIMHATVAHGLVAFERVELDGAQNFEVEALSADQHLLPQALDIYGCLHLLDNILKDFPTQLSYWRTFHKQLHVLWTFLSDKKRRDRFVYTCLGLHHVLARLARSFAEFSGQLLDHRWFSVLAFVDKVRPLLPLLKEHWSAETYRAQVDSSGTADARFDPQELSGIVTDPMLHAYVLFTHRLGRVFKQLAKWIEGCPCHAKPRRCCPLAGCRAPELAANELINLFGSKFEMHVAEVQQHIPHETDVQ
eukprot:2898109-Amphidinium_carterae.3